MKKAQKRTKEAEAIQMNIKNLNFYILKNQIGIKNLDKQNNQEYAEINDFILCERPLYPFGRTCYLQAVLHVLCCTTRLVLSFLMRDPFPYKDDTLCSLFKDLLIDQRQLDTEPEGYDEILDFMARIKPD